jgi:hypothetical protein
MLETENKVQKDHEMKGADRSNDQQRNMAPATRSSSQRDGSLTEQAKSTAGEVYGAVANTASAAIDGKKTELAGGLTTVVDTVRRVGDAITEGDEQNTITEHAAKYTETLAEKIEGVAGYFEKADLKGVARDLESYARRNPAIFLGAAFGLGVLAARFLKSSPLERDSKGASRSRAGLTPAAKTPQQGQKSEAASASAV